MFLERKHAKNPSPLLVWCRPRTWWNSTFGPIPAWCTLRQVLSGTKYWRYATLAKPGVAQVAGETPKSPTANCWSQRSWLCFLRRGGCWPKKHGLNMKPLSLWNLSAYSCCFWPQCWCRSLKGTVQNNLPCTELHFLRFSQAALRFGILSSTCGRMVFVEYCFYTCRGAHAIKIPMTCALLVLRAGHGSSQNPGSLCTFSG